MITLFQDTISLSFFHSLLSSAHGPVMTEILLKGVKLQVIHPSANAIFWLQQTSKWNKIKIISYNVYTFLLSTCVKTICPFEK